MNQASHEYKEAIKVGYNLRRKVVLLGIWALAPLVLWLLPSVGGLIAPATGWQGYLHNVGIAWLALGVVGVLFRTVHLFFLQGVLAGLAWATKIVTDPFHDVMLYWRAPLHLLRGETLDPMHHVLRSSWLELSNVPAPDLDAGMQSGRLSAAVSAGGAG